MMLIWIQIDICNALEMPRIKLLLHIYGVIGVRWMFNIVKVCIVIFTLVAEPLNF